MLTTDLLNCEREPIHIPGKIQNHGFLVAIDVSCKIRYCSENIGDFLPVTCKELLNNSLLLLAKYFKNSHLTDSIFGFIMEGVKTNNWDYTNPYSLQINDVSFYLIISGSGTNFLLEFEPVDIDPVADFNRLLGRSLSTILSNRQLSGFLSKSAVEIRKIIQYDRVMIYKFHEDGHGEVIAEDKEESLSAFLGLHYPASDIPKQARELYKKNTVRLIADVNQKPVDLITDIDPVLSPLDLTHSVLRAVSPVHIEYLKNMKVASSFSISLIHNDQLWGLIACHSYSPRFIDYKSREAATFLGEVISSTLGYQQHEEDQQKKNKYKKAVEFLSRHLSRANSIPEALLDQETTLLEAVNATGSALVIGKNIYTVGKTPDKKFLEELVLWLNENMQDEQYISNNLSSDFPIAEMQKNVASGILALRISKDLNDFLIWFRPEVISTIDWAGNPENPLEYNNSEKPQLSPRLSFEKWSQTVLNNSVVWGSEDINSAIHLKDEVASSIISKAADIQKTNERLNEAYNTLDAFSYTISHDLRTPLTIINAYGQMLGENFGSEPVAKKMIDGILAGTQKMNLMIRRILHYSQIGQSKVEPVPINMGRLLNNIREEVLFINNQFSTRIIIKNTPAIYSDEIMTMQVFSNLVSNAAKYSSKVAQPIVTIDGRETGDVVEYTIADNGIGIKDDEKEKIFELFTRSESVRDFEGSGVGLAIVRRILGKQNGKIWVESNGESGSVFYVQFQKMHQ